MPGKIFVNYRRDDERAFAARVRDRLAQTFGAANVFMDVDNLMAGQRFDRELEKALADTDIFLAVMGPRWLDVYQQRQKSGERDYVHEEIAGALKRGVTVIPVLIEGAALPRGDLLPEDIRELVLHQKHGITHENFGRDIAGLVEAIKFARRKESARPIAVPIPWGWVGGTVAVFSLATWIGAYQIGVPVWVPWKPEPRPSMLEPTKEHLAAAARQAVLREQDAATAPAESVPQRLPATKNVGEDGKRGEAEIIRPGQVFRDCNDGCPEMVLVPAGRFKVVEGNSVRDVIIQQFAVGRFAVTFAEWAACAARGGCTSNRNPDDRGWGKGRRPVINVSWYDAKEYVAWLSRETGETYRLLTDGEWEYAARAGTSEPQYKANDLGLQDMYGGVFEWCEDAYDTSFRVKRGGAWVIIPLFLRSGDRGRGNPGERRFDTGFRVARVISAPKTF